MITGDNITNEQIRELMSDLKKEMRRAIRLVGSAANLQVEALRMTISKCSVALTDRRAMAMLMPGVKQGVENARREVAEILNARMAKEGK